MIIVIIYSTKILFVMLLINLNLFLALWSTFSFYVFFLNIPTPGLPNVNEYTNI